MVSVITIPNNMNVAVRKINSVKAGLTKSSTVTNDSTSFLNLDKVNNT